ncbi:hypothetical protein ACFVRB_32475 [Streptomyces nojiriensis]|uniref:hypothetical protein n=1 Tax=Streptomyces nojiriensis TaxID=66374 RepID=UPI0036DBB36F
MSGVIPGQREAPKPGPLLQRAHVHLLVRALGSYSSGSPYWSRVNAVEAWSPGLYLVVDSSGRIVWLGMAAGDQGVTGRIKTHLSEPWKRATFDRVWIAAAHDGISRRALEAAEGWAADALDLRAQMPDRTWPPSTDWHALIASTA